MINEPGLTYWTSTGYSRTEIDKVMEEIDSSVLAARIEFRENRNIHMTITNKVEERREGHAPTCIKFLHDVITSYPMELRGTFILWMEDGMWAWSENHSRKAPTLAFGRQSNDHYTMLVPDPAFLESDGYLKDIEDIDAAEKDLPWHKKKPIAFWRGATSGLGLEGPDWKRSPRIALAVFAKEYGDPRRLDACISKVIEFHHPTRAREIIDLGITANYCPFSEFLKYRYLIDVEGNSCAWKSLFLKLASRSLTMKVESHQLEWYYDRLKPWKNIVPVKEDYSNLSEILDWLRQNDDEARKIAEAGAAMVRSITYKDAIRDAGDLLNELFKAQRG